MADPMMGWALGIVAIGIIASPIILVICWIFGIDLDDEHDCKRKSDAESAKHLNAEQWSFREFMKQKRNT